MIIEYKGSGEYPEYKVNGNIIEIAGKQYDLENLQQDSEVIIDIKDEDNAYVANIIIPPARYDFIDTGETDQNDNPIFEKIKQPLDIEAVRLILWEKITTNNNEIGG